MKKTLTNVFSKFGASVIMISVLTLLVSAPLITPAKAHAAEVINNWWPVAGAHMSGTQPFKAMVPGLDVSQYEMFWQVDGGQWNWMDSNYSGYQHKETSVNLSAWTWKGSGPYVVTFIVRQNGTVIATQPVTVYIDNGLPVQQPAAQPVVVAIQTTPVTATPVVTAPTTSVTTTVTQPAPTPLTAPTPVTTQPTIVTTPSNPLSGLTFYVDPNSQAAKQAQLWQTSNPSGASAMNYLAAQATAVWLGEWNTNVGQDVRTLMTNAQAKGAVPTFVAYAIPERDCGGYSSGGTNNPTAYAAWISQIASGIGSGKAIVVLEPDALAQITCLSGADQATRLSLISNAVATLKQNTGTKVYIDAGHSGWVDAATMASRLTQANIARADGFALNVSNFVSSADEVNYGTLVSQKTSNKHFIVDTSRNGNGSDGNWCNPSGRAVGQRPSSVTGNSLVDAFLWLKVPGESDGSCNGGPSAGTWWPSYALTLVQNAHIAGL